ncbi:MAG TPA: hypothetical protein V6C85_17900 [Allocoleopsis sp.]
MSPNADISKKSSSFAAILQQTRRDLIALKGDLIQDSEEFTEVVQHINQAQHSLEKIDGVEIEKILRTRALTNMAKDEIKASNVLSSTHWPEIRIPSAK